MKISILTLFPEMFNGPFNHSILKRAQEKNVVKIELVNLRLFGLGRHKVVDEKPYGGGAGMVLRVDILQKALESIKCKKKCKEKIILLDPQGKLFNQKQAKRLSAFDHLVLICGHYEGVDERVRKLVDEEISIGDYILTGGEIGAIVVADCIIRLLPMSLGKNESSELESFQEFTLGGKKVNLLEYPQYTRPRSFKGLKVPSILLSGDHKKVKEWREKEAFKKTKKKRPDLIF